MTGTRTIWILLFFFTSLLNGSLFSQNQEFHYKFLNLQDNKFLNIEDTARYRNFMSKLNQFRDTACMDVVHIGDSHMQAGFYSNQIRRRLHQHYETDTLPNLGFIFPYTVAGTNNPGHYQVSSTGRWSSCKAVKAEPQYPLGLSGITLTTDDTTASFTIRLKDYFPTLRYKVGRARLFCSAPAGSYNLTVNNQPVSIPQEENPAGITLPEPADTLKVKVRKKDTAMKGSFSLMGMLLEHDRHSVNYHSIGINGAKAESYLQCDKLEYQLRAIDPDWIILSLGTNEAYSRGFTKQQFKKNLAALIRRVRRQAGDAWILLTTPGDALKEEKYDNPNNGRARETIIEVAREQGCAFWDFYQVMGGDHSILSWYYNGLTAEDRLHLNKKGYQLKADLFFNAFLNSMADMQAQTADN